MLRFNIFTLFPELYPGPFDYSIMKQALNFKFSLNVIDIKKYGFGKHNVIDDKIYGGGSGMLLRPDVLSDALEDNIDIKNSKIICMSAKGKLFDNLMSSNLSSCDQEISIICPRYEGVDQRVIDYYGIEEVSIGNYILSNGDISCYILVDSIVRNIDGVLGDNNSLIEESFNIEGNLLEHSQYTKPSTWKGINVPDILLSGHHKNITAWRKNTSIDNTKKNRPDLL